MYRALVYPLLSRIEPEKAHAIALRSLRAAQATPGGLALLRTLSAPRDPRLEIRAFGLRFANPVGAAAGMDKNADAVAALLALGFGCVEAGTITPRPQPGNDRPRVWRLPEAAALLNALGFPSNGAAAVEKRLAGRTFAGVVGVNLGKNKETPAEEAAKDYAAVLDRLWNCMDYAVVNVSSPNTPGLRALQSRAAILDIFSALRVVNRSGGRARAPRPLLLKISPDLTDDQLDDALAAALEASAAGVVVANTTLDRSSLADPLPGRPGGLSGAPLREKSLALLRKVRQRVGRRLPIIGVGGIATAEDVIQRMKAGACLVQLYTAFVYAGPGLPGQIVRGLSEYVRREGLKSLEEIVGAGA
ncbi:MAG: quinone-dependent dihydroorotate dehydrogenase [Candidatus Brocadiae bacterium]|nr:quinone-dependent dihydroorotate dehydrogenase [Candidatus Brocadiia bacterium]